MMLDEYFNGNEDSRMIFECLREMIESLGPSEMRVQQSQIAFLRKVPFAYTTVPLTHQPGRGTPLILSVSLRTSHPTRPTACYRPPSPSRGGMKQGEKPSGPWASRI